jgi:uncharacterized protein
MTITLDDIVRQTGEYGQGWALPHARRVLNLAHQIAGDLRPDWQVMEYAAYLHDWGAFPRFTQPGVDHALRSRQVAESKVLPESGLPADTVARVLEAIELHDYRDPRPAVSPEALLLREADCLDFLGAIGFAREFVWGPNDLSVCHQRVLRKQEILRTRFTLPEARKIAEVRLERLEQILTWFEEEGLGEL